MTNEIVNTKNKMKKTYIAPVVEINETMVCQMMALSLQDGSADNSDALVKKANDWDMWGEAED